MSRIRVLVGAVVAMIAIVVGFAGGGFAPDQGQRLPVLTPGDSFDTSLATVTVHAVDRDAETTAVTATIVVLADHPIRVREVLGFEVDGESAPFLTRAGDTSISLLNPRVPVRVTASYRLGENDQVAQPVIVDGIWQTQDDNALLLPDHLVLTRPVALVGP